MIIRSPEAVWVGADSYIGVLGGPGGTGCKIHALKNVNLVVAGVNGDSLSGFDIVEFASRAVWENGTMSDRADRIVRAAKEPLRRVILDIRRTFPRHYTSYVIGKNFTEIMFFGVENNQPTYARRWFHAEQDSKGLVHVTAGGSNCPGTDCPSGSTLTSMGDVGAIVAAGPAPTSGMPVDTITRLINIEIGDAIAMKWVRGPIDIVRVDRAGTHWETHNVECSSRANE